MANKKKSIISEDDIEVKEDNPALSFISKETIKGAQAKSSKPKTTRRVKPKKEDGAKLPDQEVEERKETITIPKGYKLDNSLIEVKSKRLQLVMQPSLLERVKAQATKENISVNELMHRVLRAYLEEVESK